MKASLAIKIFPGGKYFTHCIGVNAVNAIANFEKMVSSLGVPVKIEQTEDHVPSFMEKWVWFQVTRLEGEIKEDVNGEVKEEPAKEPEKVEKKDEKEAKSNGEVKKDDKEDKSKEPAPTEKKEDKKAGAKDLKEQLEAPKEKGLKKEKSNVDKKGKKAK